MSATSIVPFTFETSEIRMITDNDGTTWFVLRDILTAIGTTTPVTVAVESIKQGLGDGFNNDIPITDSLGRQQTVIIVAESAATFLLSRSNTEKGRELNRFLHVEVLPKLRRTGTYSVPAVQPTPEQQARVLLEAEIAIASMLGVPVHLGQAAAVKNVWLKLGIDYSPLLALAPAQSEIQEEEVMLEPARLAERLRIKDGAAVNHWLSSHGLQVKEGKSWVPTEKGKPYCILHQWSSSYTSGYNLKWKLSFVRSLLPEGWNTGN